MGRLTDFNRWYLLSDLCYSDMPQKGKTGFVYLFRRRNSKEILYIGATDNLYWRLFVDHLGGFGRNANKRLHSELIDNLGVRSVEVSWHRYPNFEKSEKRLIGDYITRFNRLPVWNSIN